MNVVFTLQIFREERKQLCTTSENWHFCPYSFRAFVCLRSQRRREKGSKKRRKGRGRRRYATALVCPPLTDTCSLSVHVLFWAIDPNGIEGIFPIFLAQMFVSSVYPFAALAFVSILLHWYVC